MFPFDRTLDPWVGLAWLAGVIVIAFLVAWLATDVARIRRTAYIAVLAVVAGGLTWGYSAWSGAGWGFWSRNWAWGVVGGVAASAIMVAVTRRLPSASAPAGIVRLLAWEGVVYGVAEGLLLSVLPVAIMWQVGRSFGWAGAAAGALAILASVALIVVHHLGYWEFRGRLMRFPVLFCTVLSVAYLLTASPIAAVAGHVVLHAAMLRRGIELPPHARPKQRREHLTVVRAA